MVGLAADGGKRRRWGVTASRERRALEIGRAFAEIIRDVPVARELWVTVDTEEPGVHLWLITDPIDWDKIHDLYGTPVDLLYGRFPEGDFHLHLLNPPQHIGEIHGSLRSDAEQIPLRAG
jgi:hypothetical protein